MYTKGNHKQCIITRNVSQGPRRTQLWLGEIAGSVPSIIGHNQFILFSDSYKSDNLSGCPNRESLFRIFTYLGYGVGSIRLCSLSADSSLGPPS